MIRRTVVLDVGPANVAAQKFACVDAVVDAVAGAACTQKPLIANVLE